MPKVTLNRKVTAVLRVVTLDTQRMFHVKHSGTVRKSW